MRLLIGSGEISRAAPKDQHLVFFFGDSSDEDAVLGPEQPAPAVDDVSGNVQPDKSKSSFGRFRGRWER